MNDALFKSKPCLRELYTAIKKLDAQGERQITVVPIRFEDTHAPAQRWVMENASKKRREELHEVDGPDKWFVSINSVPPPPDTAYTEPEAVLRYICSTIKPTIPTSESGDSESVSSLEQHWCGRVLFDHRNRRQLSG